jgi:hypothetical protein
MLTKVITGLTVMGLMKVITRPCHSAEITQESIELGTWGDCIPAEISIIPRKNCRKGQACPHKIRKFHAYGVTVWNLDPVNVEKAQAAFAKIHQIHGKWELVNDIKENPEEWVENIKALCGDRWSLDAAQLARARLLGIIDKLPAVTKDEIDDLNKGDLFVKFLAISQILWLIIHFSTRGSRGLPTTQLEVVTLAFAVTSILTYLLLISRPKDVQTVREVLAARYPMPDELTEIAAVGPHYFLSSRDEDSIPNNAIHARSEYNLWSLMVNLVFFGGLHCLAWNYEFPTPVEARLWRVSAIVTLAVMPLIGVLDFWRNSKWVKWHLNGKIYGAALALSVVLFVAARAFILVEIVRSLGFQPPETFRTTWAANVPHAG